MQHAVELLAILLLMAVGQCVLDPSPRIMRRVMYAFVWSALAFAVAITIVSIPSVAAPATQLAGIALAAYVIRWIVGGIVDHFAGPTIAEMPGNAEIAAMAARVTGAPLPAARRAARRIMRRNDGYIALAAVRSLGSKDADSLEAAWQTACEALREEIAETARSLGGANASGHVSTNAIRFLAQAVCAYEFESVKRVLGRSKECRLASRAGRELAAGLLEKQARRVDIEQTGQTAAGKAGSPAIYPAALIWPGVGFMRLGFGKHATAFSIAQILLILYGAARVAAARGFHGNSGYVFLGVAALVHIQALLAMGDFVEARPAERVETASAK